MLPFQVLSAPPSRDALLRLWAARRDGRGTRRDRWNGLQGGLGNATALVPPLPYEATPERMAGNRDDIGEPDTGRTIGS